jgi:hypothetical protein
MTEGTTKTPTGPYILETIVEKVSLRDQFAMAALQGYCAYNGVVGTDTHVRAQYAYAQADDMLEARKRRTGQ